jgi:D-glycero-D-manno-heptose 1,7-bisphosphate phosphatase
MTLTAEPPATGTGSDATARHTKVLFLDRDGVINENRADHVKDWSEFRFVPGAPEAIARLTLAGWRIFVVSNQAIVGRGAVPHSTVDAVNDLMLDELGRSGGRIEAVAYCPHRPEEGCACRKPRPGLLLNLAARFKLDLRHAVVIGDALSDVKAGRSVGSRAILVLTGRGPEQLAHARATGQHDFSIATDLRAAADLLLAPAGAPA